MAPCDAKAEIERLRAEIVELTIDRGRLDYLEAKGCGDFMRSESDKGLWFCWDYRIQPEGSHFNSLRAGIDACIAKDQTVKIEPMTKG